MSVSVVVPVWNGRALLARLLDTLAAQTLPPLEILAVDNGSTDGASALAEARGARVIFMGRNAGFAAAVNRGIREARGEWVAILNSDVELSPDYLALLAARGAPFATGRILNRDGSSLDATFDAVARSACAWRVASGCPDGPLFAEPRAIASPPLTAALFRAELFRKVGYLEESFESYLEDVDFGLRLAAARISGVYEPRAIARHYGSASLGRWHPEIVRRISRNQLWLAARHFPAPVLRRCAWPILVGQLLWGAVALRHFTFLAWLRGKWQGLSGFSAARRAAPQSDLNVLDLLRRNERVIYETQSVTGFDPYWRLYFLLTRGGAK